jgi:ferrous iron transport protein A
MDEANAQSLKLSACAVGTTAVIEEILDSNQAEKLLEMGCVPGETIRVEHRAISGDPIAFSVSGFKMAVRREEADSILVRITS